MKKVTTTEIVLSTDEIKDALVFYMYEKHKIVIEVSDIVKIENDDFDITNSATVTIEYTNP